MWCFHVSQWESLISEVKDNKKQLLHNNSAAIQLNITAEVTCDPVRWLTLRCATTKNVPRLLIYKSVRGIKSNGVHKKQTFPWVRDRNILSHVAERRLLCVSDPDWSLGRRRPQQKLHWMQIRKMLLRLLITRGHRQQNNFFTCW